MATASNSAIRECFAQASARRNVSPRRKPLAQQVRDLRLNSGNGKRLKATDYLYHNTRSENAGAIMSRGLRSALFHDTVDPEQAELYRDLSVIWFTDCPTEFLDEDSAQFRVRIGDLVQLAGELFDPGQRGDGKHFFFGIESTPRAPREITIPAAILEITAGAHHLS